MKIGKKAGLPPLIRARRSQRLNNRQLSSIRTPTVSINPDTGRWFFPGALRATRYARMENGIWKIEKEGARVSEARLDFRRQANRKSHLARSEIPIATNFASPLAPPFFMNRCLLILALICPLMSWGESFREAEERLKKELAHNRSFRAEIQKRQREIGKATDARSLAELQEIRQILPGLDKSDKDRRRQLEELRAGLDTTTGQSEICPVHKKPMRVLRGPIRYGLQIIGWNEPPPLIRQRQFPFAHDYWDGGCARMPYAKAWFYTCRDCQRAEKQWLYALRANGKWNMEN